MMKAVSIVPCEWSSELFIHWKKIVGKDIGWKFSTRTRSRPPWPPISSRIGAWSLNFAQLISGAVLVALAYSSCDYQLPLGAHVALDILKICGLIDYCKWTLLFRWVVECDGVNLNASRFKKRKHAWWLTALFEGIFRTFIIWDSYFLPILFLSMQQCQTIWVYNNDSEAPSKCFCCDSP